MGTPSYPRDVGDELRDLRTASTAALTAQGRVAFDSASDGLILLDLAADPPAPTTGVRIYAKSGRLYYRSATGTVYGPL